MRPTGTLSAMPCRARAGFTFLECICILLVVIMGLLGVLALVFHGTVAALRAQGATTGMPTAVSVAMDPAQFLDAGEVPDGSYLPYDLNGGNGTMTSTATGYVNGYWVVRVETTTDADVISRDPVTHVVYARSAAVTVDVMQSQPGAVVSANNLVVSYGTRIVRQRGTP